MSEVLQANVFFFIASIATVVFCILVSLVLYQVYKIVKAVRAIMERIEAASEVMAEDVTRVRELVANNGFLSSILNFVLGGSRTRTKSRKRTKTSD
jgi:hypothetical protein